MMTFGSGCGGIMDDIISISSGSGDSDLEILGFSENCKNKLSSLTEADYQRYSPPSVDITESETVYTGMKLSRNGQGSPVAVCRNGCEFSPVDSIVDSTSPARGLTVTVLDHKACGYSSSLFPESHLNCPCQPPAELFGREEMTPEQLFSNITQFPTLTPGEEGTTQCGNGTTCKHPEYPVVQMLSEKQTYPQSSLSDNYPWTSQSPLPTDLHVKQESCSESLHTVFNAAYLPFEAPSGCRSYPHVESVADDAMSSTGVKVQNAESKIPELEKVKKEKCEETAPPELVSKSMSACSYSPYYCPSVESVPFSDNTLDACTQGPLPNSQVGELDQLLQDICPLSPGTSSLPQQLPSHSPAGCVSLCIAGTPIDFTSRYSPVSSYSCERDFPDWQVHDVELPNDSPASPVSLSINSGGEEINLSTSSSPHWGASPQPSLMQRAGKEENAGGKSVQISREVSPRERRYVSWVYLKRQRRVFRRTPQLSCDKDRLPAPSGTRGGTEGEESEEEAGPAEQLCWQGLSLVNSTIEERYPEGTLQLLSDFLHPRVRPPAEVTRHLLRGILLDPQCPIALATDAYALLTRIQRYHPAEQSTVQWDWGLLSSAMSSQELSRSSQRSVVHMLLQYILQTLEDDFAIRLSEHRLHCSIVSATLSCDKRFSCVRDVIGWLVSTVKNAAGDCTKNMPGTEEEKQKDVDLNLKMVFLLQKMLRLAVEVDRSPTCSSNKVSQELFQMLISVVPRWQHRTLLLETLESSLLRCKVLELLLGHACSRKVRLPMSLRLLLHFIQSAEPSPDPSDGTERWRSWHELVQQMLMLLFSYEEVKEYHLRLSITERAHYSRPPIHTVNDQITEAAMQEMSRVFLSRVSADLGPALPPQLQESFSLLRDHLLDACQH